MTTISEPRSKTDKPTLFTVGAKVSCSDGPCGKLTRVIIDPILRTLTHIVVEPRKEEDGRLVALRLVEACTAEKIDLACTVEEFNQLDASRHTDYFPLSGRPGSYYGGYAQGFGYAYGNAYFAPFYGYGGTGYGYGWGPDHVTYDAVPQGEVSIRRGDPVHASDGDIGHVAGLVIGTPTGDVTHVLLQEGHLWGKRDVSIPVSSVIRVDGVVEVSLSKHEVETLPSIDIDHPEAGQ